MKKRVSKGTFSISWPVVEIRLLALALAFQTICAALGGEESTPDSSRLEQVVTHYCADCHDKEIQKGGLDLYSIRAEEVTEHPAIWEKVIRKLRVRHMPPIGKDRPDEPTYDAIVSWLANRLDEAAASRPDPGRTETLRRLNRTEYQNAIRDLLALEIDASTLLPQDEASHGFDNVTVGTLSPTLLDRYIMAAQKISRLAIGTPGRSPGGDTFRVQADLTQEERREELPLGTRGGTVIPYTFPQDGEYEIQVRLARDRNEHVEGLREPHEIEILLDRERVGLFTVWPPKEEGDHAKADEKLTVRFPVKAGPHEVGVTFLKKPSSLLETKRQPYQARFNFHRHPRTTPAIYQVSVNGPYAAQGAGLTPSRQRIFICQPSRKQEELACAERILSNLMRRAYRRPVAEADLERPMAFFRDASEEGGFESGIEMALSAILISPEFLFRVERDPEGIAPNSAYRISDVELASRLSFFLWSSIPDEELLEAAIQGQLSQPSVLEAQVRRMLADARSRSLVSNFAGQWLYLRNLESITPDARLFPDFDDNLRQAFRRETELLFETILREDRSVLDLLKTEWTFLNERLAKHYGIPHIYGPRFRKVALDPESPRGGLLRHGSILTVTSYATRTSPVIRGKWILENIMGSPPPPPLPDVPALDENTVSASLPVRERLAAHRANPACASCHDLMDPVGFALEHFDAVGRWREVEEGQPIDATGGLPDGSVFAGVSGLEENLLRRPEIFAGTIAEKLLTYALGRGMEHHDAPAIRKITREAKASRYRFSSIVLGLVKSAPFQMRRSAD